MADLACGAYKTHALCLHSSSVTLEASIIYDIIGDMKLRGFDRFIEGLTCFSSIYGLHRRFRISVHCGARFVVCVGVRVLNPTVLGNFKSLWTLCIY